MNLNLENWQKIRNSCNYIYDKPLNGFWCKKNNFKCCFNNCSNNDTPPFVSNGNPTDPRDDKIIKGGYFITPKQTIALKLKNQGLSYSKIALKLNMTKTNAWKLVNKANKKIGVNDKLRGITQSNKRGLTKRVNKISLHNDSISIECNADINKINASIKHLKYCDYKFIKTNDTVIKIFKNKFVLQFRKDIICLTSDECYNKATKRIKNFFNNFNNEFISFGDNYKQLSRHYAILGTAIAKRYVKEGKKLFIYDDFDKKERVRIDFSDHNKLGGMPHFEFTHSEKSKSDVDKNEKYITSIINHDHYLPHEVKNILDIVITTQKEYAYHIKKHLLVQDETLKTLKQIQSNLKTKKGQ